MHISNFARCRPDPRKTVLVAMAGDTERMCHKITGKAATQSKCLPYLGWKRDQSHTLVTLTPQ